MPKILFFCLAVLVSTPLRAAMPVTADKTEILEVERGMCNAYLRSDADTLDKFLTDDFIFTDGQAALHDKRAELAAVRLKGIRYTKFESSEMTVRQQGVVTGIMLIEWMSGSERFSIKERFTDVLMRTDGHWRLLARHFSHFPKKGS